ncbi:MAG: hypothetical protein K5663_11245 [Clostridiales bacterium]|nr:hypothetical protein [Clostridiales bacterium]
MSDREKVIKGLEELRDHFFHEYKVCYRGDEEDVYRRFLVVDDSLALIRKQQEEIQRLCDALKPEQPKEGKDATD